MSVHGKTIISTDQGRIPVEEVVPGTHTIKNKQILGIPRSVSKDKMISFPKNSIADNIPNKETLMFPSVLVCDPKRNDSLRLARNFYKDYENVTTKDKQSEIIYNILTEDDQDCVHLNGLKCASLKHQSQVAEEFLK